jgi:hypothetical protein
MSLWAWLNEASRSALTVEEGLIAAERGSTSILALHRRLRNETLAPPLSTIPKPGRVQSLNRYEYDPYVALVGLTQSHV